MLSFKVRMLDGTAMDMEEPESTSVAEFTARLANRLDLPEPSLKVLHFGQEMAKSSTLYESKVSAPRRDATAQRCQGVTAWKASLV